MNLDKHIPLSLFSEAVATLNESVRSISHLNSFLDDEPEKDSKHSRKSTSPKTHVADIASSLLQDNTTLDVASSLIATNTLSLPATRRNSILKATFLDGI
jgi:hypothetical protein